MTNDKRLSGIIEDLKDNQFKYSNWIAVDYDYERSGCDGNCEYICRCTVIHNARVNSVKRGCYLDPAEKQAYKFKPEQAMLAYAIDRAFACVGAYQADNYEISTCGGYYGDEIDEITFKNHADLMRHLNSLYGLDDNKLLEAALVAEYGYLLPKAENKQWSIKRLPKSEVVIGADEYYMNKLDRARVAQYANHPFPRGVVVKDGSKYRLIDGHHRFAACPDSEVEVIVGE